jgi:hypothetical protein
VLWKKLQSSSDGGDSDSKKRKQGYGGLWQGLHLVGFWSHIVSFVLVHFAGI